MVELWTDTTWHPLPHNRFYGLPLAPPPPPSLQPLRSVGLGFDLLTADSHARVSQHPKMCTRCIPNAKRIMRYTATTQTSILP